MSNRLEQLLPPIATLFRGKASLLYKGLLQYDCHVVPSGISLLIQATRRKKTGMAYIRAN